jgi:hypothetical protein
LSAPFAKRQRHIASRATETTNSDDCLTSRSRTTTYFVALACWLLDDGLY